MGCYYLGIDQGTTFTTAALVDENWNILAKSAKEHRQIFPAPGWVEHDPVEVYESVLHVTASVLESAHIKATDLIAVGLDHQGETCLIWDKKTGKPVYNAIVWQDRRTADYSEALKVKHGEKILNITGMIPDSYHSATKLKWIIDNADGVKKCLENGDLLAGTLNTWLIWKLTGGESFVTDACSGGRLMLMDSRITQWDPWLLSLIGIPETLLPPILDCNSIFGYTCPDMFLGVSIPIAGCLTDSNAATVGGGGTAVGTLTTSYGTGSFMSLTTGENFIVSKRGLMSCCCWQLSGKRFYKILGASFVAGSAMQWLRDGLRILDDVAESEAMANSVSDTNGVYFVPAFAGLATPYWDQYARGAFMGLTSGVTREHIVRSVLESIAFQTLDCLKVMRLEYGKEVPMMHADGGMIDNKFFMQFLADVLGIPVEIPAEKETAAFGSACMAGLTTGALRQLSDVNPFVRIRGAYEPRMSQDEREERFAVWHRAVERSCDWILHE